MTGFQLSEGSLSQIIQGEDVSEPVLQLLAIKQIAGSERYRLLLSDGVHSHSSAMLATQLNELVDSGEIAQNCVIRLLKHNVNEVQPGKKIIIVLDTVVLASGESVGEKLGNPQAYRAGATSEARETPNVEKPEPLKPVQPQNVQVSTPMAQNTQPRKSGGTFYNKPQNSPQSQAGANARITPINSLTPYQNRWTIRARVTNKGSIRTWSNSRGEGKLFNISLLDQSGEIKATMFKDEVDKYFDMVEVNKVYYISKASLKTADKRYNNTDNDYEMTFNGDTQMTLCEEAVDLPSITFNFKPINQLDSIEPQALLDVIGVVRACGDVTTITAKASGKEISKRDLFLVDESQCQVTCTIWGADAQNWDSSKQCVFAVRGAKVSDFGGRSLSIMMNSQTVVNPDIPEAHRLRGWFDSVGHTTDFQQFQRDGSGSSGNYNTVWKTLAEVKAEGLGVDKADYFTAKATVIFLRKENCMYMACPTDDCNKKVIDQANGMYRCEKCQKEFPNHKWRLLLSMNICDFSDNQWITCFQDTAETVLGKPADEVGNLREQNESMFDQVFQDAHFKPFIFKMRAKMETYNDENRLKVVAVQATPIDFKVYNNYLIDSIEKMISA